MVSIICVIRTAYWESDTIFNPTEIPCNKVAIASVKQSWARERDFTFTFHFHALEKEMATHSSVLAWRIPGMGEPGGLPSMGSQSRTRLKRLSSCSRACNFSCYKGHCSVQTGSSDFHVNLSAVFCCSAVASTKKPVYFEQDCILYLP